MATGASRLSHQLRQLGDVGRDPSLLVFLIFLAGYRDRNYVEAATSGKPTIGTGEQDDAIALALASDMTETDLDVSEIAVPRHRYQRLAHSPTLKIHGWVTSLRSIESEGRFTRNSMTALT